MDTYKVTSDWYSFKQYVIDNLSDYKDDIAFMYRESEIIIRSQNDKPLDILRKEFTLTPCEQPSNFLDDDCGWAYMGNPLLFETKL